MVLDSVQMQIKYYVLLLLLVNTMGMIRWKQTPSIMIPQDLKLLLEHSLVRIPQQHNYECCCFPVFCCLSLCWIPQIRFSWGIWSQNLCNWKGILLSFIVVVTLSSPLLSILFVLLSLASASSFLKFYKMLSGDITRFELYSLVSKGNLYCCLLNLYLFLFLI